MGSSESEAPVSIGVASRLTGLHVNTLRKYERRGLIAPARSHGNQRVFSARDLERLAQIKRLVEDRGVNLAGVEIVLAVTDQIQSLRAASQAGKVLGPGEILSATDGMLLAVLAGLATHSTPGSITLEDAHEPRRTDA